MNPALVENHPELAKEIASLEKRFNRGYDFARREDGATFVEGLHILAEHIAMNSSSGALTIDVSRDGIVGISVQSSPRTR